MNERINETTSGDRRTTDLDNTDVSTEQRAQVERGDIARNRAVDQDTGFLPDDRMNDLRGRWSDVQAEFVDDPRRAVQDAQSLVGTLVDELTNTFRREREGLESQWDSGGTADTEALRVTLQRYRSFFNRLLST